MHDSNEGKRMTKRPHKRSKLRDSNVSDAETDFSITSGLGRSGFGDAQASERKATVTTKKVMQPAAADLVEDTIEDTSLPAVGAVSSSGDCVASPGATDQSASEDTSQCGDNPAVDGDTPKLVANVRIRPHADLGPPLVLNKQTRLEVAVKQAEARNGFWQEVGRNGRAKTVGADIAEENNETMGRAEQEELDRAIAISLQEHEQTEQAAAQDEGSWS